MSDEKTYEQCDHDWNDEKTMKEFIARVGNSFIGGADHFKMVVFQRCKKCNKLQKI